MKCDKCGAENPDYANFCQECGNKICSEKFIEKKAETTTKNALDSPKQPPKTSQGLGIDINQIKKDLGNDDELLKAFIDDVNSIIGKYGSTNVKNEKEFQKQQRRIDYEIGVKKKNLSDKLKIISSDRIQVDKIRDENEPFHVIYSITLKEAESPYKERTVIFTDSENNETKLNVFLDEEYIDIPDINFYSISVIQSKDNKFILAYNDSHYDLRDGTKKLIKGKTIFINQNKLFLISSLTRPNDGKLAENGNFIINDWISFEHELSGIFYAFNSQAEVLIEKKFNSNLGGNGISKSGHYGVVETLFSNSDDQNKIFFFDLDNRKLLWERERDAGNIKKFEFDENENSLLISYEKSGKYRYSFKGEFIDKDKFIKERVLYANGYELFDIAKEKMDDLDYQTSHFSDYKEILSILDTASNKDVSPHTKARIHRMIGEIYYNYNKTDLALFNLEKAISYNPKVGVKRLYDKLKKL
ncbi:zinc ribbon domain-containing protein [Methanobacterium sp. MZD130B]|jgi:hypothetical protein|uniref:zinc ribbon domain-containing protein n=1 Tax=Methanobacterium sp. MZD130B TaxID=3394378 RepID=UPI0039FD77F0